MKKITKIKTIIQGVRAAFIIAYYLEFALRRKHPYDLMFSSSRADACKATARLVRMKHGVDEEVAFKLLMQETAKNQTVKGVSL